jgi:hypothetical protein
MPDNKDRPLFNLQNLGWNKGVTYNAHPYSAKLDHKGAQFRLDDPKVQMMLKLLLNGDIKANMAMPFLGGNLNADASRIDNRNSYSVNGANIPVAGGNLNFNVGRQQGGSPTFGAQFQRQF